MLESMIENPMPTRAEVTDVAHAATTGADSTMLSGETAKGEYPQLAVEAMHRILKETESHLHHTPSTLKLHLGERSALAEAAVSMAQTLKAPAIAIHTRTGATARLVSALRPGVLIFACAETEEVQRSLQLCHGIIPLLIPAKKDPESSMEMVLDVIEKSAVLPKQSTIVVIADTLSHKGEEAAVQIRTLS
jgi:pyruvate kinase